MIKNKLQEYYDSIRSVIMLSDLFSETTAAPYLNYRLAENIYCNKIENVDNLGRLDIAIDAIRDKKIGVGIKTFIHMNGNTNQKIAEFNKDRNLYDLLNTADKVRKIADLRNKRLEFAINTYKLDKLIYHCVTRDKDKSIRFYETPMDLIDIKNIKNIKTTSGTIQFEDGLNEYRFNLSKSTLYKRFSFVDEHLIHHFEATILSNPLDILSLAFKNSLTHDIETIENDYIFLPLYSYTVSKGNFIPERSGLNQWNASGRIRNVNEVYIPVSKKIHNYLNKVYYNEEIKFFPNRDTPFKLKLPDGSYIEAKLCQDSSKALMSNPNKDLGQWLLRTVLRLEEGEIVTYEKLQEIGVDSVKIIKENEPLTYSIEFSAIGSYDDYAMNNDIK